MIRGDELAARAASIAVKSGRPESYVCSRCRDSRWLERSDGSWGRCPGCPADARRLELVRERAARAKVAASGERGGL